MANSTVENVSGEDEEMVKGTVTFQWTRVGRRTAEVRVG